jgi:nicotinate-nucleotide pyrophosphorylase (carboxylating)
MTVPRITLRAIVELALAEDLGRGDLTSEACVPESTSGAALLRAREASVFCGAFVVREVFAQIDPRVLVEVEREDGSGLVPGQTALRLSGPARSLLAGERVALNFVQRLSGVASLTRRFVAALPIGSQTRIVDTRKTTPGLRALERYAVRCGGGHNHREDLSTAVLIKDNHIAAAGGIAAALERARLRSPHTNRIECEVDSLEQLQAALQHGADVVLLDNFDDAQVEQAVRLIGGRAIVEVSGGINLDRVARLGRAGAGVDVISVGALTHSAPAIDLGLDWVEA